MDLGVGIEKMKEEEARLDKIPFIAAYLDPKKPSPEHEKANWRKVPTDHPLFADYLITEHPDYYRSRTERRYSGIQGARQAPEEQGRSRRTQSLPSVFPPSALPTLAAFLSFPGPGEHAMGPRLDALIPPSGSVPAAASPIPGRAADAIRPADPADARPHAAASHDENGRANGAGNGRANAPHPGANPDGTDCAAAPSAYKAYLAGIVGIGLGLVGGLAIAGAFEASSTNGSGNT
jgi:hypothetical protein